MENLVSYIAVGIAVCVYIAELATIKLRINRMLQKSGDNLFKVQSVSSKKFVFAMICCPLVIVLAFLTRTTIFVKVMMCAIAVVATEVLCRDYIVMKNAGIYRNGIAVSGQYIAIEKV